jgi:hypothetical protein
MNEAGLVDSVRTVLKEAPFAMRQLAADSGLSYDVLRSWRCGRRKPNRASVRKLVVGLNRRAERMKQLASELRKLA